MVIIFIVEKQLLRMVIPKAPMGTPTDSTTSSRMLHMGGLPPPLLLPALVGTPIVLVLVDWLPVELSDSVVVGVACVGQGGVGMVLSAADIKRE